VGDIIIKRANEKIAVIGLGYVGLPLAIALSKAHLTVVGFDINESRIRSLRQNNDYTGEIARETLENIQMQFSSNPESLKDTTFYIVTVPTPVDKNKNPDLNPLKHASTIIAKYLKKGDVVVFESTVYPGVTEEFCGQILEQISGLHCGIDFSLAYSPERINPGDKLHTVEKITKVVSGQDADTLERVVQVYEPAIQAGVFRASSIKVAEAAKVIENTQRDVNIALMNELALIFDRMGLRTQDVLEAARTKWNFLGFSPGLVGGHCIGVDPYYLTQKAQSLGYHPEIILAGRRLNDGMGRFIAQKTIKLLIQSGRGVKNARIGILGLTFKENVTDLRNSRVPDIIQELVDFGTEVIVHDPIADISQANTEYAIELCNWIDLIDLDAIVVAVPHQEYTTQKQEIIKMLSKNGVLVDIKSVFSPQDMSSDIHYWSL
jgi:UDP-N-acetyl-D-glucosamine/UDP-N-acetyl-D-galactosamine dehydrogenase